MIVNLFRIMKETLQKVFLSFSRYVDELKSSKTFSALRLSLWGRKFSSRSFCYAKYILLFIEVGTEYFHFSFCLCSTTKRFICVHVVFDVSRLVLYDRLIYFLFTYIIVEKPSDLKVLFIMTFSSQVTSATFFIKIIYT